MKYIAVRRIQFEGLKGKPAVEPGEYLPSGVDATTIKDLLECKDIKIERDEIKLPAKQEPEFREGK